MLQYPLLGAATGQAIVINKLNKTICHPKHQHVPFPSDLYKTCGDKQETQKTSDSPGELGVESCS